MIRALSVILLAGCAADARSPAEASDVHAEDLAPDADPGCQPDDVSGEPAAWQVLSLCRPEGQLLSVWAASRNDAWVVGAGGQILRFDGCQWSRVPAPDGTNLWWVHGFSGGPVFMAGEQGTILRWQDGALDTMSSGTTVTLYGLWGPAPDDLWAVGFDPTDPEAPGAVLHFDGEAWSPVPLPDDLATADPFKVSGAQGGDVVVVGRNDLVLRRRGDAWIQGPTGVSTNWVTVTHRDDLVVVVGGKAQGAIAELTGGDWQPVGPDFLQPLQGVCLGAGGAGLATGLGGTFVRRAADGSWTEDADAPLDLFPLGEPPVEGCAQPIPDYHACAFDDLGGTFVVGGSFLGGLTEGVLLYHGPPIPSAGL